MALSDITPYENNPRNNEEAVEKVANSIKEFGFNQPIVVDKDNVIIVGHTRYLAAQELGLTEAPEGLLLRASAKTRTERDFLKLLNGSQKC